jgi:predicted RNA binding protein YcfA (HicA-like mRNA interferase family)
MPLSGKEMVTLFEKAGWVFVRQTGSHMIMRHKDGRPTQFPITKNWGREWSMPALKS